MTTFQLSPMGGEIFAGRDARRALVPTDAFQKLMKLEGEMKAPGFAEMQLDRHATALWLSGKLQRPAQEVLANFDAYARAYWGKDVTPGMAYDRIVEYERQAMQMAVPSPQAGAKDGGKSEQAIPDENAGKSWQFLRAATGGFAKAGHDTVGGTLAMVEGAINTLGGMPDRKGVSEDPAFSDALFKLGIMEYDGTLDTPEGAMVKAQVDAGRARLDEDFQARMAEYRSTIRGSLAGDVRAGADFFYELGNESAKFYGVSEEYRASTIGKVAEAGGSIVASSALLAAGSLGFLGKVKGTAQVVKRLAGVAGAGQIYAGVEQDRMAVEGDAYRNAGWTFASNMANAGVQQVIERVPILDNTLERAMKHVPHKGGVVKLGDVLREMRREAVRSGFVEAGEEVIQGAWDDFIVDMSYDDTRVDLSDGKADYLKRRVGEAVAGFGGGVMLGGTFGGAAIFDRNQAAKKAERAFADRAGEMLTPEDFAHLRRARTDAQIKAMPMGETLLAAANGDAKAAEAYNRSVFDANFVRTDGLAAFGDEVGTYKGMPAVRLSDGRRVPIDMADLEQVAWFNAFRRQVAAAVSGDAAVAEFQQRFGESLTVERPVTAQSLQQMVDAGTLTADQAEDARKIAVAMGKVAEGVALSNLYPEGSAKAVEDSKTKLVRMVTSVLQGKNAAVAIEEVAEGWIQAATAKGDVDRGELRTLRMDWQQQNGEKPAEGVSEDRADIEWFSRRVIEYALGAKVTEVTGSSWWRWIRTLGEQLRDVLKGAQRMRQQLKDGTLDPRLEGWFKAALGMGEEAMQQADATLRAKEAEGAAQLLALAEMDPVTVQEAMASETFPNITGNVDDGFAVTAPDGSDIGGAQTLEDAKEKAMEWWMAREMAAEREQAKQDAGQVKGDELMDVIRRLGGLRAASVEAKQGNFAGELRALAESMSTADRLRTFRKSGADLDALREALVEEGFDYQTPSDVLDAIERSLRGKPQYATYSNPDSVMPDPGSFSLRAKPEDDSNTLELPDGSRLVGPTTFSITAYHGTPHKVDKFKTANIGTGEENQVYGWGLYFAENKAVGEEYRKRLTKANSIGLANEGNLYTVELLPDADAFLDWDVSLAEQKPDLRAKLEAVLAKDGWGNLLKAVDAYDAGNARAMKDAGYSLFDYVGTLGSLYNTVATDVGAKELSLMLAKAGIPGIRYLDGGSRNIGEGTRNFVLFDEKLVKIVAENGTPVDGGGATFSLKQGEFPGMDGGRGPGESQGELPLEYLAARRKIEETWEKWMQSQGYAELVRMRSENYTQDMVSARAKHDSGAQAIIESVISPTPEAIRRAGGGDISRDLQRSTQAMFQRKARDRGVVTAYAKKVQGLGKFVLIALDYANLNGFTDAMNSMADRFGFRAELEAMRAMFTRVRREAIAAGVPLETFWEKPAEVSEETLKAMKDAGRDIAKLEAIAQAAGYRLRVEEYWPRHVIDYDKYVAHLTGTTEGLSTLGREYELAKKRADSAGVPMTEEQLLAVVEKAVVAMKRGQGQGRKPGGLKQRTIEVVPIENLQFYMKSVDSAYRHIESMHDYIQVLEFFGDKVRFDPQDEVTQKPLVNLKETMKAWVPPGSVNLTAKQERAIKSALTARFSYQASPELVRQLRTFGHLQGLTQIYTAGTASFPDFLSVALESNLNLGDFVKSIYQAATGKNAGDLSGFGLDARDIMAEFQTRLPSRAITMLADKLRLSGKPRSVVESISMTVALKNLFKWLGISKLTEVTTQARANAQVIALRKRAEAGNLSRIQQDRISRMFLPEERAQLLADVKAGKTAAESPLVAIYLWGGVADWMPVSLDQMPEQYLKHPVLRLGYTFKHFLVVQTAAVRRVALDNIVEGIREGDARRVRDGIGMLLAMLALLVFFGVPGDMLRAFCQNRPFVLSDTVYWKMLGLTGVSHFTYEKAKQDGFMMGAASYVLPPFGFLDDAWKDSRDIWDGKLGRDSIEDMDLTKLRIWNSLPVVGRTYQGWYGSDSEKRINELDKGDWFRMTPEDDSEKKAAARRRWLLERYGQE